MIDFYPKLILVVLLCIPVALVGIFLFSQLVNQALDGARREKENSMERKEIDNRKRKKKR